MFRAKTLCNGAKSNILDSVSQKGDSHGTEFYTLSVLYLVYSFLGWVGETTVATAKGKHFANRGAAAGPFCFVYGIAAVLMAVGLADLRT